MKLKEKDWMLIIETNAFQWKNWWIYLNWGWSSMLLWKPQADTICFECPDFDPDEYIKFYNL